MADKTSGILKLKGRSGGNLYGAAFGESEARVPGSLIAQYDLVEGVRVSGPTTRDRQGYVLAGVDSVCGLAPEAYRARTPFRELTAIDPHERFNLAAGGEMSMRVVDLVAPIGKGTRGLIVAPPKAGKTTMLEHIAGGIRAADSDTRIIVLLIDERPEEMTYFRRKVEAEVFASSSDQSVRQHVELAELMLAHIRTELECGHDVVVLVDSLTRLVRAFNLKGAGAGRMLSGGVDASALEIPRRFFGLARTIEGGGSVTIIATVLVDTGSRMDQLIYEEFKGTGNSETVLDRSLAEERIFPAINLRASGTRKEYRLYDADDSLRLTHLRRALAQRGPRDAMLSLLRLLGRYSTNEEMLSVIPVPE